MHFKLIWVIFFILYAFCCVVHSDKSTQNRVIELVEIWSKKIGHNLTTLSDQMTRKKILEEKFEVLKGKTYPLYGSTYVEKVARDIRILMETKTKAVKKIAEYAEFLSYHRKTDSLFANSSYYYFNADNITSTQRNYTRQNEISRQAVENECRWWCDQKDVEPLMDNQYTKRELGVLFKRRNVADWSSGCDCNNLSDRDPPPESYLNLPLEYDERFGDDVNFNLSVAKIAINVYNREQDILEGVRWSESLDLVFKENMANDPTLTWQYFASPKGFMRHYPAVKWSDEQYNKTYDFRTRSWYTEAMTSPKDIIILVDKSGSMSGEKVEVTQQIVNNILDTLNDNDFVNIYVFNNSTDPVVDCFKDTLVQANEENLRLLREVMTVYDFEFQANLTLGFDKAFDILQNFRNSRKSSDCIQAIMLISEGIGEYDPEFFKIRNWDLNTSVRIFTYQIGIDNHDARHLEWIACANKGYYVNMTFTPDVREKVLNYLNVMSRPINYNFEDKPNPIWTYLHVDLADRRLSNWLWRKYEGLRQREVFLDYIKREFQEKGKILTSSEHLLLKDTHDFEKYEIPKHYNYMTTVSMPVYGRGENETDLIGVAGVDVPIKLFKDLIPHHKLGVNGYAFIVTNNGYILMHPDHRREFENILKPTFNRVDLVEVEIMDDDSEPRLFHENIVKLRRNIVNRDKQDDVRLKVKFTLHEKKRVILSTRHYFFAAAGPFTFGIVLPNKYGNVKIDTSEDGHDSNADFLTKTSNWKVHPEWNYCNDCNGDTPEEKIRDALSRDNTRNELFKSLVHEAHLTRWFDKSIEDKDNLKNKYLVNKVFLATQSGLTRWTTFYHSNFVEEEKDSFETRNNRAIDEDWYRRAVEENLKDESMYIYSVPFEISGYENNTMITGTRAVFIHKDDDRNIKTPFAVVGLQFNHRAMYELYNDITTKCNKPPCTITCESDYLNCFILDNNAYIVLSDEIEYTGRYIGDIRPDIMFHLISNNVFEPTRMFDYQAICQKLPPTKKKRDKKKEDKKKKDAKLLDKKKDEREKKNAANRLTNIFQHVLHVGNWFLTTLLFLLESFVLGGKDYQSLKNDTIAFEKLEINKTLPTPCDQEMWLFNLKKNFPSSAFDNNTSKFVCEWPYVVHHIPNTNLLFLAINNISCPVKDGYKNSPTPIEIVYAKNESLPCYIAQKNNYTRRATIKCHKEDERENDLNKLSKFYCGHTWK